MKSSFARSGLSALALTLALAAPLATLAQNGPGQPPPPDNPQEGRPQPGQGRPGRGGAPGAPQQRPTGPKPYKEVITAEAKSDDGVFTVHRINDKVYFEIPESALNREMLWSTEIAQLPAGFGYGGTAVGDRVVRWTRRNNQVFLRNVSYDLRAETGEGIQRAVRDASLEPIILAFDVEAEGEKDSKKTAVIDVSRLLTTDVAEFSARRALGGAGIDPTRTYIDRVKAFPMNVEMRSLITYTLAPPTPGIPGQGGPRRGPARPTNVNSVSATIHYSLVMLPEKPMMGRLSDSRVGYFTEGFQEFGKSEEGRVLNREYATRYRLEKKDPNAAVSEPVKPIVYYVSREVPEEWRAYVKKGIEMWQPAFEQAGFKNAIIAKDAPTEKEDADWDPEDARYSVIRWAAQAVSNAMGPHVHDPRSGEIMSAHVIMWHDVLKLAQTWYFVQVAPLDPRANKLPLPKELMGELLQYVVAHEVGHTLGLRHNHKASSSYTIAQLRNKEFTEKYGNEASIMDYGRFNYVAQPGDNARLIPIIGPYDKFAIEWGYKPILNVKRPDDEKPELDKIAARQVSDPTLRFGGENEAASADPTVQTEDLGSDPIEATYYGLKNIDRVAQMLVPATTKFGEDYALLDEMYGQLFGQRQRELGHVAKLIGGVVETDYHAGRGGDVFKPVPPAKQKAAVDFLLANAFQTPKSLLIPNVINRIEFGGVQDRVLGGQRAILAGLMEETRIKRMLDQQAVNPGAAYPVAQMVNDLQAGIWAELGQPSPTTDVFRRNLQRAYIAFARTRVTGDAATQTDLKPILMGALRGLMARIDAVLPRTKDAVTALHLRDARQEIDRIVNPKI